MSSDLWEQLMTKEKNRVKKLEEEYGEMMREKKVRLLLTHITAYVSQMLDIMTYIVMHLMLMGYILSQGDVQ